MDKYNVFVRINYTSVESEKEEVKPGGTRVNNGRVSGNKYLIGGGVYNRKGGTVIFSAKNLEEVKHVTVDKPLLKNASINYNVAFIPKGI